MSCYFDEPWRSCCARPLTNLRLDWCLTVGLLASLTSNSLRSNFNANASSCVNFTPSRLDRESYRTLIVELLVRQRKPRSNFAHYFYAGNSKHFLLV